MAHHKSAIKRIRRNERTRVNNKQYMSSVKTAVKKFRTAVLGAGQGTFDKAGVRPLFVNAQAMLAKAATKGLLHKNNAARRIGRLSAMLKSAEAGQVALADKKAQKKSAAVRRAETTVTSETATPAKATTKAAAKSTKTTTAKATKTTKTTK